MNFGNWIPNLFYDLIGRITPGSVILLTGYFIFQGFDTALDNLDAVLKQEHLSTTLLVLAGIALSYTAGILLGALAYLFTSDFWGGIKKKFLLEMGLFQEEPPSEKEESVTEEKPLKKSLKERIIALKPFFTRKTFPALWKSFKVQSDYGTDPTMKAIPSEPFIYDFIMLHEPAVGSRLAKLSAERSMCRVLAAGAAVLGISYLITPTTELWSPVFWQIELGLLFGLILAMTMRRHLTGRSKKLMRNNYYAIKHKLSEAKENTKKSTTQLPTETLG